MTPYQDDDDFPDWEDWCVEHSVPVEVAEPKHPDVEVYLAWVKLRDAVQARENRLENEFYSEEVRQWIP